MQGASRSRVDVIPPHEHERGLPAMNRLRNPRRETLATLAMYGATVMLVACGGGTGDRPATLPTFVSVTVTCPNGTSSTGTDVNTTAATTAANAACPPGKMTSITPADASLSVSPDTFGGISVMTDSTLDQSSLTTSNMTLKAGSASTGTTVQGTTVTAIGTTGWKLLLPSKLRYGQLYSFAGSVKNTLGRVMQVASTFTTAGVQCTAPQMPTADGQSCV